MLTDVDDLIMRMARYEQQTMNPSQLDVAFVFAFIQCNCTLTLLVPISDFAENAKCLKLPWFYQLLMFQCATQICGHFLFCTQCQFPNFPFLVLKIDLHSQLYFHHFYCIRPCAIMARLGEKLQNEIEPVIRDFIDCMEPGTPRVEIESYRREDSCQVFICFKKAYLRNTLCSRPDLKFPLKVMSDICDGF